MSKLELDEVINRFCNKSHYAKTTGRVKRFAFSPPCDLDPPEVSVDIVSDMSVSNMWEIYETHINPSGKWKGSARCVLSYKNIKEAGLEIDHNKIGRPVTQISFNDLRRKRTQ